LNTLGVFSSIPLAIVDIETTGASPNGSRILEIAIIRVEEGKIIETFSTIVDPEQYIPPSITGLTGISERDIKNAPTFATIASDVERLLKDCVFVAHNARFDYAFIKHEFTRLGMRYSAKCLCTVKLSRFLYSDERRHDLSTLIDRHGLVCSARHRALGDAEVLIDFLKICTNEHSTERCQEALDHVLKKSAIPAKLDSQVLSKLPQQPGVYTFYGDQGEILYIGKSINIRNRVLSHFSGDHKTGKELRMVAEVSDVSTKRTSGNLSALLLESFLIKKEQPLYNRLSRQKKRIVVAEEIIDAAGYKTVALHDCEPAEVSTGKIILGIFKSLRQAKDALTLYAQEHTLCPQLLGLENGKTGCFWSQLGKCNKACIGKEEAVIYNTRFDEAFAKRRIKRWPFGGPILFTERDSEDLTRGTAFIIDDWRLIESYTYDEAGNSEFLPAHYSFDYDSYKILSSHLLKAKKRDIKLLGKDYVTAAKQEEVIPEFLF
jgi:DNA polymerase-3 subunit epsilon